MLGDFAEAPWAARLKKPIMAGVVRVNREFDDPLPAEAKGLDAAVMVLFYHDSVWLETDRTKMNKAIFAALKPGGTYCVVDHAAAAGHGLDDVKTLHRIEEAAVVKEISAAGFTVAGKSRRCSRTPPTPTTGTTRRPPPPTSAGRATGS